MSKQEAETAFAAACSAAAPSKNLFKHRSENRFGNRFGNRFDTAQQSIALALWIQKQFCVTNWVEGFFLACIVNNVELVKWTLPQLDSYASQFCELHDWVERKTKDRFAIEQLSKLFPNLSFQSKRNSFFYVCDAVNVDETAVNIDNLDNLDQDHVNQDHVDQDHAGVCQLWSKEKLLRLGMSVAFAHGNLDVLKIVEPELQSTAEHLVNTEQRVNTEQAGVNFDNYSWLICCFRQNCHAGAFVKISEWLLSKHVPRGWFDQEYQFFQDRTTVELTLRSLHSPNATCVFNQPSWHDVLIRTIQRYQCGDVDIWNLCVSNVSKLCWCYKKGQSCICEKQFWKDVFKYFPFSKHAPITIWKQCLQHISFHPDIFFENYTLTDSGSIFAISCLLRQFQSQWDYSSLYVSF